VNIYAPPGSSNRQEKENFYNVELTYFLRSLPPTMIMGKDFNCVDVWETVHPRAVYIHYTSHGATRLDRIHVTSNRSGQKLGVETVVVAFTSPSGMSAS
jgi:hypothetical protein